SDRGSQSLSGNFSLGFPVLEGDRLLRQIRFQEPEHPINRTNLDYCLTGMLIPLVVPAVPPIAAQPGERPLYRPPPRQRYESHTPRRTTDDLNPILDPSPLQIGR